MAAAQSRAAVERMLVAKLEMERDNGDHRWYRFVIGEKVVARTFVSTGSKKYKTLGDDLIGKMARQLHVSTPFLTGLVRCTNSRDDYLRVLREQDKL